MTRVDEVVPAALAGERVDRVVALITGVTRAEAATLVDDGRVLLNGTAVRARSRRLEEGDALAVEWEPATGPAGPTADPSVAFAVVHEDDDVVVVDKPAGLVVHPGAGHLEGTLVNGLLARYPELAAVGDPARPGIVHRLDKGTSGLLVVARSAVAYDGLVAQLSAREVDRRYVALVWGHPEVEHGVVDAPIGRSTRDPTRMAVSERGREAVTRYEVVARFDDPVEVARLACKLETGRTHQIRVHLAALGHPPVAPPAPTVPARRRARLRPPGDRRAAGLRLAAARRPHHGAGRPGQPPRALSTPARRLSRGRWARRATAHRRGRSRRCPRG